MPRRRIFTFVLLTAACAAAATWLEIARPSYCASVEYQLRDLLARAGRTAPVNPDLVFLAIDSDSVSLNQSLDVEGLFSSANSDPECRRGLELMAKPWPWNREIYALITQRLLRAGAKVVAFDCLFPGPAPGDDTFRRALDQFKAHIVIGGNFVSRTNIHTSHSIPSSYQPPSETLLAPNRGPDNRVGFVNFLTGEDKTIRGVQYRLAFRDQEDSTASYLSLAARMAEKTGHAEKIPDGLGERVIRFTGATCAGFPPHSIFEIFVPEYWEHNYGAGEFFRNKTVLVGAQGKWQKDEFETPLGSMPGAEIHLNALNALLHGEFLRELPPISSIAVVLLAALIGGALSLRIHSPWIRFATLGAINLAGPFAALGFYNYASLYLPCLAPVFALNATVLLCLVSDFAFAQMEEIRLRSTLKTRDDLTHMIVHDLRSPLTIVTGYIDALQQMAAAKLTPREGKCIAEALHGAHDMRDMITTLLDVSRLEAGKMPLRLESNDACEIARKASDRFAPLLAKRTLRCDLPDGPVLVRCDADVIRRVLENLIGNAIKFTPTDGSIRVTVEPGVQHATLCVIDNGAGIPPEQHKRIFEKFGQTDAGSQKEHSTGIGLTFCRLAVEAHGGNIGVQSQPERGSTFHFTVPTATTKKIDRDRATAPIVSGGVPLGTAGFSRCHAGTVSHENVWSAGVREKDLT